MVNEYGSQKIRGSAREKTFWFIERGDTLSLVADNSDAIVEALSIYATPNVTKVGNDVTIVVGITGRRLVAASVMRGLKSVMSH